MSDRASERAKRASERVSRRNSPFASLKILLDTCLLPRCSGSNFLLKNNHYQLCVTVNPWLSLLLVRPTCSRIIAKFSRSFLHGETQFPFSMEHGGRTNTPILPVVRGGRIELLARLPLNDYGGSSQCGSGVAMHGRISSNNSKKCSRRGQQIVHYFSFPHIGSFI